MNGKTNRYRTSGFASALVGTLLGSVSCGGDGTTEPPPPPPVAPVAVGSIPAQVMTVGQTVTVDVSPFFRDPDGGALTYTAASSAVTVLTVSLTGSNLTLTAVAPGTATVTVTATNPGGLTATQSAEVTVEAANRAPEPVGTIPAQTMIVGQTATVDVASFFSDPDGDDLTYAAESTDAGVATASMSGSSLTVTAVAVGTATVTVTAADPSGLTAMQSAEVMVEAANQAPEPVGTIPAQTMTVGQTATVDVASFFSDPDGDALTYEAESSNEAAVTAGLEGSNLTLTALAVGTATLKVTATDPGGLSATQSAEVTVEAANQAPEPVGTIPAQTMTVGGTATVDVSAFFADPDGDALTYEAESSDAGVVSVALSGSTLTLTAMAAGTATVTATATDPGGLSATQIAEVTVAASAGFRDDFVSAASLDDWEIRNADAAVTDGVLRLTNTTDGQLGLAEREVDPVLTDWTIRVRMGRAANDGTVRMYWFSEHSRYRAFGVWLGPLGGSERNYWFVYWDADDETWYALPSLSGNSDAIRDAPDEFTDVTIGWDGGEFFLMAGDTELWRFTPNATFSAAFGSVTDIWLAGAGDSGSEQRFDWFEVTGTESAAMSNARRKPPAILWDTPLTRRSVDWTAPATGR